MSKPTCLAEDCDSVVLCSDERCFNHTTTFSDEEKATMRSRGGTTTARRFHSAITPDMVEEQLVDLTQQALLKVQAEVLAHLRAALAACPGDLKLATQLSQAAGRMSRQIQATELADEVAELTQKVKEIKEQRGQT